MKPSSTLLSPVITFFSPSAIASKRAQSLLSAACSFQDIPLDNSDDELDQVFQSSIPGFSRRWSSVASVCTVSGSVIHFCSMDSATATENKKGIFSLLGITNPSSNIKPDDAITEFRTVFAKHAKKRANTIKVKDSMGTSLTPAELLRSVSTWGLPLLSFPESDGSVCDTKSEFGELGLKEIVVPHFDHAIYADGSTILSKFSGASMFRPAVGVYQWTNTNLNIRPLPTAAEDQVLPPPSLIFHSSRPELGQFGEVGIRTARIGYGGNGVGQLMLLHEDLAGLDIRYCPRTDVSSSFCEAQESLMAGSLGELQSTNALLSGQEKAVDDSKLGNADCWIEVRANLKKPSGFWKRSNRSKPRIAKIPDLPYQ